MTKEYQLSWELKDDMELPLHFVTDGGYSIKYQVKNDPVSGRGGALPNVVMQTSTDGITWTRWGENANIQLGRYPLFVRNTYNTLSENGNYLVFYITKTGSDGHGVKAYGNINSLLGGTNVLKNHCFSYLFYNCSALTRAPRLNFTEVKNLCYAYMFRNCTSLLDVQETLPAMTMAMECYHYMFGGCTSLVRPPRLPATTLADTCYERMFSGCTNITIAPPLPATQLVNGCYDYMFYNCSNLREISVSFESWPASAGTRSWLKNTRSTGVFICPSALPALSGDNRIPSGWTIVHPQEA